MTGIAQLRKSSGTSYRTVSPIECPHCHQPVFLAGAAQTDAKPPHLALWAVAPDPPGTMTERELAGVTRAPPVAATGVAMPVTDRGRAPVLPKDRVPL